MNVALQAYGQANNLCLRGAKAEAEALLKAARFLEAASAKPERPSDMVRALRFNHNLWAVFQGDVGAAGSPLPDDLRADILSLSLYVDKNTLLGLTGNG